MNTEEQISVKFESAFLNIFIEENAFENVVCEKSVNLSRPRCVNNSELKSWWFEMIRKSRGYV